jgi:hypothetical protein
LEYSAGITNNPKHFKKSKAFQEIENIPRNQKHSKKSKTFQEIKNFPPRNRTHPKLSKSINQSIQTGICSIWSCRLGLGIDSLYF